MKRIWNYIISKFKPKTIDKITPWHELYDDLKGHTSEMLGIGIGSLFISLFFSGLIYQMIEKVIGKIRIISIMACFKYGLTKTLWLTVLMLFFLVLCSFKAFRSLKKTYHKNYDQNLLESEHGTYGVSHWQTEKELRENFNMVRNIKDTTDEVFGYAPNGDICAFHYPTGSNRIKVYFGPPGTGKSSAIIKTDLYQAILRGDSVIMTDSKGALYSETSAVARKYGYIVRVLNLKPSEFRNSDGFNIFSTLHPNDDDLDIKSEIIANVIIKNTSAETDSFWAVNEFNLMKCVIMYVSTNPAYIKAHKNNLPEMFTFFSTNDAKKMAGIFATISDDNPMKQCYNIFANCTEQNQGQIINGAAIRLSKLTNPYLRSALSYDEINPILPMRRKCVYYVIISDQTDAYKFAASLFFSTMFSEQCAYSDNLSREEKKKQLQVLYLCDEYKNFGGIQSLPMQVATVRSRKIEISIMLQNKQQLLDVHTESEANTILECCVVKGLLGASDCDNDTTAAYFEKLLGNRTVIVENTKFEESSADIMHVRPVVSKTLGEGKKPLMPAEDMINGTFKKEEIIYVITGMFPIKLDKYFSEKMGEAIHPLEKESFELGERKCSRHMPKWRKALKEEEEAKQRKQQVNTWKQLKDTDDADDAETNENNAENDADNISNESDTTTTEQNTEQSNETTTKNPVENSKNGYKPAKPDFEFD